MANHSDFQAPEFSRSSQSQSISSPSSAFTFPRNEMAKAFTSSGGESRNKTIATLQAWGCMMISQTVLKEIRSGRIAGLGPKGVPSGIDKQLRAGPVRAETMGLVGDEQADLRVHGGPDKAILHYSRLHY